MRYVLWTAILFGGFVHSLCAQSAYVSKIVEYVPAPGQFTNTGAWGTPAKATSIVGGLNGGISLGGFGGYIIVGFDHRIENDPDNPYGVDFTVFGNPLATGDLVTWSEPGVIMVMQDANGNGQADDTWYELAGSDYYFTSTSKRYQITYTNPKQPVATNVPWLDDRGQSGYVLANSFHLQPYYPAASYFPDIDPDRISFSGTCIKAYVDRSNPSYIQSYHRAFGYADNTLMGDGAPTVPDNPYTKAIEGGGGDAFDIDWAVDALGNSVHLSGIDFIKIYTAVNADAGWLGEVSTEVRGVADVAPNPSITGPRDQVVLADLPLKVNAGYETQIEAYAFHSGILRPNPALVFSVSDASKAEVTPEGRLVTKIPGSVTVVVRLADQPEISDQITLVIVAPEGLHIRMVTPILRVNTRQAIAAFAADASGNAIDGITVQWKSSDESVMRIVQQDEKMLAEGEAEGTAWLVAYAYDIPKLKDSVLIHVLPEASVRNIYFTLKDQQQTLLPRKQIPVDNFDLNAYLSERAGNYGIDAITDVTAAHAIAKFFGNEAFASDLRFRDDDKGDHKLYLWKVPEGGATSLSYVYGYGGSKAPTYTAAWFVKINQHTYVNDLAQLKISEGDEVVVYHIGDATLPWELVQLINDKDSVDAGAPVMIRGIRTTHFLDDDHTVHTESSEALNHEPVTVNGIPFLQNGSPLFTDDLGSATLTFAYGGWQEVSIAGETVRIFVRGGLVTGAEEAATTTFMVWPNPTDDVLNVKLTEGLPFANYQITDARGIVHLSGTTGGTILLSSLSSGWYVLQVMEGKVVRQYKFVKR